MTQRLIFLIWTYSIFCSGSVIKTKEAINKYLICKMLAIDSIVNPNSNIPLSELPENLQIVLKKPREKVEINGIKPYYLAGENIDLEIFVKNLSTKTSTEISNTLYLDFVNLENGKILKQLIIRLNEGKASVKYKIDNALATGNYLIRSYTNWNRNFSDNGFFTQKTTIFSQTYGKELGQISENYLDTIKVYVEGNKLVEGLNNRLIIKATNNFDEPRKTSFQIISSEKEKIIEGETDSLGMAYFDFTPSLDLKYSIYAENRSFSFPKIEKFGSTLKIDNLISQDKLKVLVQSKNVENQLDTMHLLILKEGEVLFCKSFINNKPAIIFNIPKKDLSGELGVYLVDKNINTIAQRNISVINERPFEKSIQIDRMLIAEESFNFFEIKKDLPFWDEKGITIKGRITRLNGKPNKKPVKVSLVITSLPIDSLKAPVQNFTLESIDKFSFEDLVFFGKKQATFIAPENRVIIDTLANIPVVNRKKNLVNWNLLLNQKDNSDMQRRMEQLFEESLKGQRNEVTLAEVKVFARKNDKYQIQGINPAYVVEEKNIINKPYLNSEISFLRNPRIYRCSGIPIFIENQKLSPEDVENINDLVSPATIESILVFEDNVPSEYSSGGNTCAIVIKLRRGAIGGLDKKNESIIVNGYDF